MEYPITNKMTKTQKEALALERFFPHNHREKFEELFFGLTVFFLSFSVLFNILINTKLGILWPIFQGLFLVSLVILIKTILIEIYANSLRTRMEENEGLSFATLIIIGLHNPKKRDLTKAFLNSPIGKEITTKLGIGEDSIKYFLKTKVTNHVNIPSKGNLSELAAILHEEDPYFRDFLLRLHVTKEHLVIASKHVEKKHSKHLSQRPLLSRIFTKGSSSKSIYSTAGFSIDSSTRDDIEEFERFHKIIFTEQAISKIVDYFKEDIVRYATENGRAEFIAELIEETLQAHKERFHGASVIMPSDVRQFIINKQDE